MKTEVETLNPTRVRLLVEVPYEELRPDVDSAYKRIAAQVQIPGFRKGKVPPQLIDQRFGRGVALEEAVNSALPRFYGRAVQESDVQVVGQPDVDVTEVPDPQTGGELKFTAEVDVRPQIELPDLGDLEVTVDSAEVTDADVDAQLDALRARFGSLRTVQRAVQDGDYLTIDLAATIDGEPVEGLSARGMSYHVGVDTLIDGLDDAVLGLSVDESRTFPTTLVGGEHVGQQADVEVTVRAVREQDLPALDDDFAQTASEFDTLQELRDNLLSSLQRMQEVEQARTARDKVLEAVLERVDVPLPQSVVQAEIDGRQHSLQHQLGNAGMTKEQYLVAEKQSEEDFDAEVAAGARDAVKAQLLLDAVAAKEEFGVSEEELTAHLIRRAADLNIPPNELAQRVMQQNQVPVLMSEVMRGKALDLLVSSATVRDHSGRVVNLSPDAPELDDDSDEG